VIPVKSFRLAKQRLSEALDAGQRERLGRALAEHTAVVTEAVGLIPLIVTADAEVAAWATNVGFPSLPDPGIGLDAAAHAGTLWAASAGIPWVVLHCDLPLLQEADLEDLVSKSENGEPFLAPSADGGTSAIGSTGAFEFSFGPGSFHRHLARLPRARIVFRPGLAHDVDAPNDLRTAMTTARGEWLVEIVG
jgi:2-phospho-L-lactate guanylyltransferase